MSAEAKPRVSKVIMIGDSGAGKTSFMNRYMNGAFSEYRPTIGVDFLTKSVETSNKNSITLQLWDTAGRERFVTISRAFYRSAEAVLIFFDITQRDTFGHVKAWFDEIARYQNCEALKVIIGTKRDLANKRQVSFEEASELAQHLGALFFEVSAKENINISEAMTAVAAELESRPKPTPLATVPDPKSAPTKESSIKPRVPQAMYAFSIRQSKSIGVFKLDYDVECFGSAEASTNN